MRTDRTIRVHRHCLFDYYDFEVIDICYVVVSLERQPLHFKSTLLNTRVPPSLLIIVTNVWFLPSLSNFLSIKIQKSINFFHRCQSQSFSTNSGIKHSGVDEL